MLAPLIPLVSALWMTAAAASPAPASPSEVYPEALPPPLTALLTTGRWDRTPAGLRIIALSNLADACAAAGPSPSTTACLRRVREVARRTRPPGLDLAARSLNTNHGLWLSHYNLILGDLHRLVEGEDPAEYHKITAALAARGAKDGVGPSYANQAERWPADQAATLASLARHDRLFGTSFVVDAWARYRAVVPLDDKTGLPLSEIAVKSATSKLPRGCALSFTVRYLAEVDFSAALDLWNRYRDQYLVSAVLFAGLREWPPGVKRRADVDSGPIVNDVGAAATAFGLIAARAVGDDATRLRLEATARLAESLGLGDGAEHSALASSIRLLGQTLPTQDPTTKPQPSSSEPSSSSSSAR